MEDGLCQARCWQRRLVPGAMRVQRRGPDGGGWGAYATGSSSSIIVYLFGHESWASWRRAPGALDQRPMQAVQATAESRPPGIKSDGLQGSSWTMAEGWILSARSCGLDVPVKMGLASYMVRSAAAQGLHGRAASKGGILVAIEGGRQSSAMSQHGHADARIWEGQGRYEKCRMHGAGQWPKSLPATLAAWLTIRRQAQNVAVQRGRRLEGVGRGVPRVTASDMSCLEFIGRAWPLGGNPPLGDGSSRGAGVRERYP